MAVTKLHASLGFAPNEKVDQIMSDYRHSKVLEVQQRALDYFVIRANQVSPQLLIKVPLTEQQVAGYNFDNNLSFLDAFV